MNETNFKVGYCRVSTQSQSLDLQIKALKDAGCQKIFSEKMTGRTADRPELIKALHFCREGDIFTVWKLDRLGRSMKDLITLITDMEKKGIQFQSLTENLDTTTSAGRLLFGIMSSLSQFHVDLIRERTLAGLSIAKENGNFGGRPKAISDKLMKTIEKMYKAGISVKDISKQVKVSIPTIYRYMNKQGGD